SRPITDVRTRLVDLEAGTPRLDVPAFFRFLVSAAPRPAPHAGERVLAGMVERRAGLRAYARARRIVARARSPGHGGSAWRKDPERGTHLQVPSHGRSRSGSRTGSLWRCRRGTTPSWRGSSSG